MLDANLTKHILRDQEKKEVMNYLYALTQFYNRNSEVLLITETEKLAEARFEELYKSKQLSHLQSSAFFIEKFHLNQHRNDWDTVKHNIEDILPQELKMKEINDWDEEQQKYGELSIKIMMSLSVLGCVGFFNLSSVHCNSQSIANLWKNNGWITISIICKIHGCTEIHCKCSDALDKIFKELEKEEHDVFYSAPKSLD